MLKIEPYGKKGIDKQIIITAISALTIIEVVALFHGINGTMMALIIATIAGMGGWIIPTPKIKYL